MISPFHTVSALAIAVSGVVALPAEAQALSFNVPAQPVGVAVRQFARQANVQIIVSGNIAAGRRSHAIAGAMDVEQALSRMLADTGLIARQTTPGVYVIVAAKLTDAADAAAPVASGQEDADADIVVTGLREAQIKATAEKHDADNIVEALEANDVGKLPDQNVAEAIKRLPGLSVANDQGEGRYVIIRGIDPNLVNVTLNGQTLPAPEPDGRVVKLDDLPSAMIQSISVAKSTLPNQDANAIGGSVDIRTKTAFDSDKPFFADARASQGRYDLNHKWPYELDGTIGGRFGAEQQFGAVVSVNYSKRPIESENYQGAESFSNGVPATSGLRDYNLDRTRLGIVGNFDWHPSDTVKLYLRTNYSKFTDHETRDQNRLAITGAGTTASVSDYVGTATVLVRRREENDNTKSATLGGEFDNLAGGTLTMSGGWTNAEKVDPIRSEFTFTTDKKKPIGINYDGSTDPYTMVPSNTTLFTDPGNLIYLNKYNFEHRYSFEEMWQARADYSHPIALGDDSSISFGAKYLDRHKNDDHDKLDYTAGSTKLYLSDVAYLGDTSFYGNQFSFGDRIDYQAARDAIAADPTTVALDTASSISDSLSSDYDVREKITAGYVMATLKFGGLTVIPGVRVEHTEDDTKAKVVTASSTLDDGFNSFGHNSYTDVFPGINAKYEFGNDLLARAAVTTSIGRPNYPDLAPYVVVEDDAISIGNPDLKPYKAVNYDASLEYYPQPGAVLSVGFFHKDIDNPIYSYGPTESNVTIAGVLYEDPIIVNQLVNADKETITGIELNAQMQFTSLPGLLGGFGISANYTHVWGHATASVVRSGNVPLAFQSKNVGNVQLFFEKYGLAARLAFNYRSAYLDTLTSDASTDEYTDGNGQLDFHVSYQVTPQFTVFGDAINLTDAPWRRYMGSKQYLVERERYGAQFRGGVQLHF